MGIGILDYLFGAPRAAEVAAPVGEPKYALDCYRYLLRTAPPLAIERAHAQVFLQLLAADLKQIMRLLRQQLPVDEQRLGSDCAPSALARFATSAELRYPGVLERALAADSHFAKIAHKFTSTAIAQQFLGAIDYEGVVTGDDASAEQEFDYEDSGYEAPPVDYFFGRNDVTL